jgi:hypothetical protein
MKLEDEVRKIVKDERQVRKLMIMLATFPFSGDDCAHCGYDLRSGHAKDCLTRRFAK